MRWGFIAGVLLVASSSAAVACDVKNPECLAEIVERLRADNDLLWKRLCRLALETDHVGSLWQKSRRPIVPKVCKYDEETKKPIGLSADYPTLGASQDDYDQVVGIVKIVPTVEVKVIPPPAPVVDVSIPEPLDLRAQDRLKSYPQPSVLSLVLTAIGSFLFLLLVWKIPLEEILGRGVRWLFRRLKT